MRVKFSGLAAALLVIPTILSSPAAAFPVSEIVVFGDSNVDIGRAGSERPGDGQFPPPNTVGGRASDGPILPEHLARRLGVPAQNYGVSGATTGEDNLGAGINPDLAATGLLAQIDDFAADAGTVPAADTPPFRPDTLVVVFAGSNDLNGINIGHTPTVDAAVARAATNLSAALHRLSELGAPRIAVATRTPRPVLSEAPSHAAEPEAARRNDAAGRQLNSAIRQLVAQLDAALPPKILLLDAYSVIRDLIAGSGENGFRPYVPDDTGFCGPATDCTTLINYDGAHKTSAVHARLAEALIDGYGLTAAPGHTAIADAGAAPAGG